MRPVDKGEAPQEYTQYKDAEKDLEARLGAYCSFCEMAINHAPEVEHKEAKAKGGAELEWENLCISEWPCCRCAEIYLNAKTKLLYLQKRCQHLLINM